MSDADQLRIFMDAIPDYVYFKDEAGRFMRVNRAQIELPGVKSESESVDKTDFDFFDREHAERAYEDERNVLLVNREIKRREAVLLRSQKIASIGNLAGKFAHEFNNILGGVQGCLVFFKTEVVPPTPCTRASMELASRKAARLIEGLPVLSGYDLFIGIRVDLEDLVSAFVERAEVRRFPGVSVKWKPAERLPPVCVNLGVFDESSPCCSRTRSNPCLMEEFSKWRRRALLCTRTAARSNRLGLAHWSGYPHPIRERE